MATDATGSPTTLGIPTYNVDNDAPSGLGFNAAMGSIDTLIAGRVKVVGTPTNGQVPVWNNALSRWEPGTAGAGTSSGAETLVTVAASGAAQTINFSSGSVYDITLTANCTLTYTGASAGQGDSLTVVLRQDATGSRTITWPGSVTWVGGSAPLLQTAAGAVDIISFFTVDGGTTWFGFASTTPAMRKAWDFTVSVAQATLDTNTIIGGNIPSGSGLVVAITGRGTNAAANVSVSALLNNDSAANYYREGFQVFGATPTYAGGESLATTSLFLGSLPGSTATANRAGTIEMNVPNHAGGFHKQGVVRNGFSQGTATANHFLAENEVTWAGTAALQRIALSLNAGNFDVGTRFTGWIFA